MPTTAKRASVRTKKWSERFGLLVDLGVITVADDYNHATALKTFMSKNCQRFHSVSDNITDTNFSNPTRILKPGDKLHVRAFEPIVNRITTEECVRFLVAQKAIFTGAQGLCPLFEQKGDQLPRGFNMSFDEEKHLFAHPDGIFRVPNICIICPGLNGFNLTCFEGVRKYAVLLCFTEVESSKG